MPEQPTAGALSDIPFDSLDLLPQVRQGVEPDELERAMLEFAYQRRENSRLACQIVLTEAHDGMVVKVPARQF